MCFHFLNEKSAIYTGADPYDVSQYVNQHVGTHDLRIQTQGSASASLIHRKFGAIDLCRLRYGGRARVLSEGLGNLYHVQFILRGHCHYDTTPHGGTYAAGHVLVINPDEPIDLTYSDDCEKFILKVPACLFDDACVEHRWQKPEGGLRFLPVPYRFEELESLLYLLTLICQEAESDCITPQILGHYHRVVASKLMTMLRHNVCLESPNLPPASFERLERFIEDNIKRDIAIEELAQQARMSQRSLYLLFDKYAHMTPMNFIRQKKLERVYSTLMDPACQVANITAVALDYGFNHLGRFSECYKAAFGVLPSESFKARRERFGGR
jgi:AraC-like DNA-binding protein